MWKSLPSNGVPDLPAIRDYYDATWLDYRVLWLNRNNRAIHFGYWDAWTESHAQALLLMNRVLAEAIGIRAGQRILDAGCGVGGSAIWLAETYQVEVVGITSVIDQVVRARRYAAQRGVDRRVSFYPADYTCMPFAACSFDVVWALESVCHAPDKRQFFSEACRVLRPGCRLGMVEYLRRARPLAPPAEALLHSWLSGWAIPDIVTPEEVREFAAAGGFDELRLVDIGKHVQPSLRRLYRIATLLWPAGLALKKIGLRSSTQHGNQRGARDQYMALMHGLWSEFLVTATA